MSLSRYHAVLAIAAFAATACAQGSANPTLVTRYDSAGIEVIVSRGVDHTIDVALENVLRLGGHDEGPQAFHGVHTGGVAFDSEGRLYVLDSGNHRVVVFDRDGRYEREFGRAGSGPGELGRFTGALAVSDEGDVGVFDMQRQALTRWNASGEVIEGVRFPHAFDSRTMVMANGRVVATVVKREDGPTGPAVSELISLGATDTLRLASFARPAMRPVQFRNCQVQISGMGQIFEPTLQWAGSGSTIVTNAGVAYELTVLEDDVPRRVLRRDVAPIAATREHASREIGDSMRISFGTGSCAIPPVDVADARGIADVIPVISRLAVAPDGSIWVERNVFEAEHKTRIDVFDSDGAYGGTLPADTPWPAAFRSADEFAAIERDEFDLPYIVIKRIRR